MKNKSITTLITILLLTWGVFFLISSIMWACSQDTTDKWFSRIFLSAVCLGLGSIIKKLK